MYSEVPGGLLSASDDGPNPSALPPIAPTTIRYVKFGPAGAWVNSSIEEGRLYFGTEADPHDQAARGDWEAVRVASLGLGMKPAAATANTTEMEAFYSLGSDGLWISFARGHLWWGFADEKVLRLPERLPDGRCHYRQIIGGWRRVNRLGEPLRIDKLSSSLTQLAGYRRTICKVADEGYLLRVINAEPDPLIAIAQDLQEALVDALTPLISRLHWSDFELFVDLLLNRLGWRRVSQLGGLQADIDILAELPATGERWAVQVKSRIDRATMLDCQERLQALGADRLLIVSHSPSSAAEVAGVDLWDGRHLASQACAQGLTGWLIDHCR
jgi:hypothetical protein